MRHDWRNRRSAASGPPGPGPDPGRIPAAICGDGPGAEASAAGRAGRAAAEAGVTRSRETYNRQAALVRQGNPPQARVDESTRNLETAIRRRESGEAALQLAIAGASPEERALA